MVSYRSHGCGKDGDNQLQDQAAHRRLETPLRVFFRRSENEESRALTFARRLGPKRA